VNARSYGQFCGFARALELVGDRWAFMIVRDLLVGPKRFSDLLAGLPGIPTNILTARLKQLEAGDVVRRRALPRPPGGVAYELTERGKRLEDGVIAIGRWGAAMLDAPRPGEVVTVDSLAMALRTIFRPENAQNVHATFELRMGEIVLHAVVDGGRIAVARGAAEKPDLVIEAGPSIRAVMAGEMTAREAISNGAVRLTGKRRLFDDFAKIFRI
jgi:DNA-binding HxlR family transcriptional regulator/putative sterol carrier protein